MVRILNDLAVEALLCRRNGKYPNVFVHSDDVIFRVLTGLEASDGAVVLSNGKSSVFVDGRYALAARQCWDLTKFEILDLKLDTMVGWIEGHLPGDARIAYDPLYFSHAEMEFFFDRLPGRSFFPVNLKKTIGIPEEKFCLQLYYNRSNVNKMHYVTDLISGNELDAYLVCDPCSIAWLLDIRDLGQKYTPVALGRLLVTRDGQKFLYLDSQYDRLESFKSEVDLLRDLAKFSRVGIDKSQTAFSIQHSNFVDLKNPCMLPKSLKNEVEICDMKLAAQMDSTAIVIFLHWFHTNSGQVTELVAAKKLLYFRRQQDVFLGESFKTISAADEHAALVHYSPNLATDKVIENLLLIDSGGQYKRGTTDITRTISPGKPTAEQKFFYTLVLKGHIALANAKFPPGTTGAQLDLLARNFLLQYSKDYDHGTGHGIGCMSHVHEGPVSISQYCHISLQPGMILSNEPGYYQENAFGIRLENMLLVVQSGSFLCFEVLSLVPFEHKFIDYSLLEEDEILWLQSYHRNVVSTLKLPPDVRRWLQDDYLSKWEFPN
ncbi:MAG: M24 family metallopeptidase [Holosporaceae bacterium]|nr:M24 family metallopeptidase [Holosporaceae bacterium]